MGIIISLEEGKKAVLKRKRASASTPASIFPFAAQEVGYSLIGLSFANTIVVAKVCGNCWQLGTALLERLRDMFTAKPIL